LKHLSTDEEKSTERPRVVASEIGETEEGKAIRVEKKGEVLRTMEGNRYFVEKESRDPYMMVVPIRVNLYMRYGLKKVEPPTKKRKNGRD